MAVAGILAMLIILMIGMGCIFASIIGLILCRIYEKIAPEEFDILHYAAIAELKKK